MLVRISPRFVSVWQLLMATALLVSPVMASNSPLDAVIRMIEDGQLAPAEHQLRDLLEETGDPAVRDLLGIVLGRQGRFDEAERQFTEALAARPDSFSTRQNLARLYVLAKREADAARELRAAAKLGDLERDLAMKLAVAEAAAGNTAAAEKQWRSLAERFDSVQALLFLARSRSAQGDIEGTAGALRQALDLAPSSEEVLRAYARASIELQEHVSSILALEPLVRMHPTVPEYRHLLGVARLQVGDTAGAVEALKEARRLEPHRSSTLVALGMALNTQDRYSEAREVLSESLRLEPGHLEALASLAEAEEGLDELDEAERHVVRVLARDPGHIMGNLVLGTLRMKQGRFEEARGALAKAVEADPGSPKAHYQLSLAYARLGDRDLSRRHRELYQETLDAYEESLRRLEPSAEELPP